LKRARLTQVIIYTILLSLAVAPAFALGEDNRNILLIAVMGLSPIIIIALDHLYKLDIWLILLMASLALAPLLHHPESMRWSTVLYSWMFCFTFMAYNRLLHTGFFTFHQFINLLRVLILAYFTTLLIQQFCVVTGLPVFNLRNYNPVEPWKLNSLSAEPSHSGRIVGLLFFCFISAKEICLQRGYILKIDSKKDKWIWFAFLYTMTTMGSATAILFIFIVFLKFIKRKNILPLAVLSLVLVLILGNIEIPAIDRTIKTTEAVITFDTEKVIVADHSASFRIVPVMVLITFVELFTLNGLLGNGIDSVSSFLYQYIPGGGDAVSGGGFLQVWYEYGFLAFLFLLLFTLKATVYNGQLINLVFWFFLVFSYGINNQIVWLCLILLHTNNHFIFKNRLKYAINT